jgi:hypothetical protein
MKPAPRTYAIRVVGHLDDHWSARLGGLAVTRNRDGTTTVAGAVADQAHLHGVLAGLRDIGATLLSLCAADLIVETEPLTAAPPSASWESDRGSGRDRDDPTAVAPGRMGLGDSCPDN